MYCNVDYSAFHKPARKKPSNYAMILSDVPEVLELR
jgi:hypothetical protein